MKRHAISHVLFAFLLTSCATAQPTREPSNLLRGFFVDADNCGAVVRGALNLSPERARLVDKSLKYADPVLEADPLNLETDSLRKKWAAIEGRVYWSLWKDEPHKSLRFVRLYHYLAKRDTQHAVEMYGEKAYQAFLKGIEHVESVPKGRLHMSLPFMAEANRAMTDPMATAKTRVIKALLPAGIDPNTGGHFRKINSKTLQLEPVDEQIFKNVSQNPVLRWIETPNSKPGRRVGIIAYPKADDVPRLMMELADWYAAQKSTMDPIELAARFQHRFVSIHPYTDQNGRTSRILMDRILQEFDLPPPVLKQADMDYYFSEDDWVRQVREGVYRAVVMAESSLKPPSAKATTQDKIPTVFNINFADTPSSALRDLPGTDELRERYVGTSLEPGRLEPVKGTNKKTWVGIKRDFQIGGGRFTMLEDGFLYDNRGVPHIYFESRLWPVADKTYLLYQELGAFRPDSPARRAVNPFQEQVYVRHLKFLRDVEDGSVVAHQVSVAPYETVKAANKAGTLFLYPWQREVFEHAIRIEDTDPFAVLSTTRGGQTLFERSYALGERMSVSAAVAQYEWMDMKFVEYLDFARVHAKDLVPQIMASRRKLHAAGRQLVEGFLQARAALSAADQAVLARHSRLRLFDAYFSHSKLSRPTLEEALKDFPDTHVALIRSDYATARYVGFVHEGTFRWIVEKFGGRRFVEFARNLAAEWDAIKKAHRAKLADATGATKIKLSEALTPELKRQHRVLYAVLGKNVDQVDVLLRQLVLLLESRYDTRGAAEPFERLFVDHVLHMTDQAANKSGSSWSLHTDLYINENGRVPFVSPEIPSRIYIARVPRSEVARNFASKFFRQYEVVANGRLVKPHHIRQHFDANDFRALPDKAQAAVANDFIERAFFLKPAKRTESQ